MSLLGNVQKIKEDAAKAKAKAKADAEAQALAAAAYRKLQDKSAVDTKEFNRKLQEEQAKANAEAAAAAAAYKKLQDKVAVDTKELNRKLQEEQAALAALTTAEAAAAAAAYKKLQDKVAVDTKELNRKLQEAQAALAAITAAEAAAVAAALKKLQDKVAVDAKELNRKLQEEQSDINDEQGMIPPPLCDEPPPTLECNIEGATRPTPCGDLDAGTQQQICKDGKWVNEGPCVMPIVPPPFVTPNGNGKIRYLFDVGLSIPYDINTLGSLPESILDPIRRYDGRFWRSNTYSPNTIRPYSSRSEPKRYDITFDDGGKIILKSAGQTSGWKNYIQNIFDQATAPEKGSNTIIFEDHAFKIVSPMTKRESQKAGQSSAISTMYANIRPNYNYYESEYEEAASNINERILPNMYAVVSKMLYEHDRENSDFYLSPSVDDHVTLGGAIDFAEFQPLMMPPPEDSDERSSRRIADSPSDRYFKTYASKYTASGLQAPAEKISMLNREFKNIMISHSNFDLLKSYNEKKHMFPMYFEVEFSTDRATEFAELLKDTDLGCTLMKATARKDTIPKEFDEYLVSPSLLHVETGGLQVRRSINLEDWFDDITQIYPSIADFDGVFLGLNNVDMEDDENQFYKNLSAIIFKGSLQKILKEKTRTFQQIMEGELASSEAVMYGIEKLDRHGTPLQYFYLPNSNEIDVQRFIDTQVQYGKYYTYKIFVWQLVYGNRYMYEKPSISAGDATIEVICDPSVKLFEVPYYEYTNKIMDKPPVQPNVDLIPFRGVNNKIKINLSPNTGAYNLRPVIFNLEEEAVIDDMMRSQERLELQPPDPLAGKLEYRSDDEASMYEVYRLDFHPKSYDDFIGNKLRDVNPDVHLNVPGSATSASMHDKLIPNKKYWYIFRSIDNHGHVSYPTPVYQVEIMDDDGAIYPLIEVVEFKEEKITQNSKNLKKLMQIVPAFPQTLLNTEDLGELDSIVGEWNNSDMFKLGVQEESVWNKTFKIRLTSKKTGKKVDLKVKFENHHDPIKPN